MNTRYFVAELDYQFKVLGLDVVCSVKTFEVPGLGPVDYGELQYGTCTLDLLDASGANLQHPRCLIMRSPSDKMLGCLWTWRREDGTFDYADMAKRAMEWFAAQKDTQNG
jgi:hypothetical protein